MRFPVTNEWLALGIFLAAAGTDLLDGYLARRWKQVTTVGTLLDPIADKLLISAALVSLVQGQRAAGLDGDPDYRPRICGVGTAPDRRCGRLHH
ncbi:MAG: CDP-alcohol phosphatidyltransferase family protein [Ignavibacteriota bacterium]